MIKLETDRYWLLQSRNNSARPYSRDFLGSKFQAWTPECTTNTRASARMTIEMLRQLHHRVWLD